ncbi:hypothetical protein CQW23_23202 [Capsicum baccatum]|uniref:Retrovirus-related Pol polyprotein from transposon TNT 1-94 n=1 Tax=Capsicum baccatum TaxID=33114 RepID=A0A2G2VRB6_CAPBA|nr:hypothetical protein CQW23_23202 [Capsicum baccatum]
MQNAKPISTPLVAHFKLSATLSLKTNDDPDYMSRVPHCSVVGYLMYVMVCSRPDLSNFVSAVSRYIENCIQEHYKEIQWIFRYVHGSADICLQFGKNRDRVIGYYDSYFAEDHDKRRSLTSYVFTICGCAILVNVDNVEFEDANVENLILKFNAQGCMPYNTEISRAIWNIPLTRQPSPQPKYAARVGVSGSTM